MDQPHDYEPGDTRHLMSTDPDCRICGETRATCERREALTQQQVQG